MFDYNTYGDPNPHRDLMRDIYAILENYGAESALGIDSTVDITYGIMEVVKEYLPIHGKDFIWIRHPNQS